MSLSEKISLILLGVLMATHISNADQAQDNDNQIHLLMPHSGSGGHAIEGVNCQSWRFAVETNTLQKWKNIRKECEEYVREYMLDGQYKKDCSIVANAAYDYVKNLTINRSKDIWIFDVDETTLSNLPYYSRPEVGFGAHPFNRTAFNKWQRKESAVAISTVLELYKKLLSYGVKVVFLTGVREAFKKPRENNLKKVGYHTWEKVIFKQDNESKMKGIEFKSNKRMKLEKMGYRIIGNMGDQWTDLLGPHPGLRTFKLPNPMYYVG